MYKQSGNLYHTSRDDQLSLGGFVRRSSRFRRVNEYQLHNGSLDDTRFSLGKHQFHGTSRLCCEPANNVPGYGYTTAHTNHYRAEFGMCGRCGRDLYDREWQYQLYLDNFSRWFYHRRCWHQYHHGVMDYARAMGDYGKLYDLFQLCGS